MQASEEIFALWDDAQLGNIVQTFTNVYGATGYARFNETVDARDRHDAVRVVKSIQQLWEDAPYLPVINTWPCWSHVCLIAEHIFDEDYPPRKRVPMATRDPNINMYSEAVAPDDDIQDGGLPAPDVSLNDLENENDDEA